MAKDNKSKPQQKKTKAKTEIPYCFQHNYECDFCKSKQYGKNGKEKKMMPTK